MAACNTARAAASNSRAAAAPMRATGASTTRAADVSWERAVTTYEHAAQDAAHLERVDAESQSAEEGEPQDVADAFNSRPALTWY